MWKNDAQMSGFAVTKKAPSQWKRFFLKKNPSCLLVKITSIKQFLKTNGSQDYLTFGDFKVPKNCYSYH